MQETLRNYERTNINLGLIRTIEMIDVLFNNSLCIFETFFLDSQGIKKN